MESPVVPPAETSGTEPLILVGTYDTASRPVKLAEVKRIEAHARHEADIVGFPEEIFSRMRLVELASYAVSSCLPEPLDDDQKKQLLRWLSPAARILRNYRFSDLQSKLEGDLTELGAPTIPAFDAIADMEEKKAINSYEAAQLRIIITGGAIVALGGNLPTAERQS